ncbi:hypothetical protein K1718_08235 [Roseibium porphyridii]|uniref:Uncharacterized protein n=1 Tax=Roseibium porphyridii TaxID=2866279 RepID=A0ABY8F761_9HYPH|nr:MULTISPECIES: hypothetical protein [Stappiaceae]WFE91333.1 hypothetical protein K1718_08235 [Roseibium sp. KMA01]
MKRCRRVLPIFGRLSAVTSFSRTLNMRNPKIVQDLTRAGDPNLALTRNN